MKPLMYAAVTAQQVVKRGNQVVKIEWVLDASAADGLFVQVHDARSTPAEAAVPLKWWPATAQGFQGFLEKELPLTKGLYVCLSSTGPTKTLALGGSDKLDNLQVELFRDDLTGLTEATASAASSLTVWAHAATNPKRLVRGIVTAGAINDAAAYVLLVAFNGGSLVILLAKQLTASVDNVLDFGSAGRGVGAVATDGTVCHGAKLVVSTSPTAVVAPADNYDFFAEYRA